MLEFLLATRPAAATPFPCSEIRQSRRREGWSLGGPAEEQGSQARVPML